jgi:hypothetical protein
MATARRDLPRVLRGILRNNWRVLIRTGLSVLRRVIVGLEAKVIEKLSGWGAGIL